jgi:hypothetical protein
MTPALVLALALAATPGPRPLAVGDTLPRLRGDYLAKRDAELPGDARGRIALLALGFTYASRHPVEDWSKRFREAHAGDTVVTWFEIPMMGGAARMARPFIDGGMRRGTPKGFHGNVITVWHHAGEWRERMAVKDPDTAHLLLLDRDGRIAWMHAGPLEDIAWKSLEAAVEKLRGE